MKKKITGVVVQVGVDRGGFRDTKKKRKRLVQVCCREAPGPPVMPGTERERRERTLPASRASPKHPASL